MLFHQRPMVCKRGCRSPKVLGPTRFSMHTGPSIYLKYSVDPSPVTFSLSSPSLRDQTGSTLRFVKLRKILCYEPVYKLTNHTICDTSCYLVPFVQFKKRGKHSSRRQHILVKLQTETDISRYISSGTYSDTTS